MQPSPKSEPTLAALYEEIRVTVSQEAQIIQAVFQNPPVVMQVFLQRVFAQVVSSFSFSIRPSRFSSSPPSSRPPLPRSSKLLCSRFISYFTVWSISDPTKHRSPPHQSPHSLHPLVPSNPPHLSHPHLLARRLPQSLRLLNLGSLSSGSAVERSFDTGHVEHARWESRRRRRRQFGRVDLGRKHGGVVWTVSGGSEVSREGE